LNPIVVKELRQAVRSWTVTGMLLLFLIVLFATALVLLVTNLFVPNRDMGLGAMMFEAFLFILAGASVLFIPLYVGIRVGLERQENNIDLLYVSTLSPGRIIRGKFFCGAYMALLFFSACMPFMAFTNLLRGIDLPTVLFILFWVFLVVCVANMVAIFLACLPVSRPFKALIVLYGLFQSFWLMVPLVTLSLNLMRSGVGAMMFGRSFWFGVLTLLCMGFGIVGFFYQLSVALISPPSANRALPVRIYITIAWLVTGLLAFGWAYRTRESAPIAGWTATILALMLFALLVTVSNSDHLSVRVRRTIPASGWKKALAFVFYNGAAGGLLWGAAIVSGTCLSAYAIDAKFAKPGSFDFGFMQPVPTLIAYAFDYALLGLFVHRKFLPRRPPKMAGVLAIMLASAWAIALMMRLQGYA